MNLLHGEESIKGKGRYGKGKTVGLSLPVEIFMEKQLQILVSGKVQGVGFRWSAYEKFVELGLIGKAENTKEGAIRIVAKGEEVVMQELVNWAHQGPQGSQVVKVEVTDSTEDIEGFKK